MRRQSSTDDIRCSVRAAARKWGQANENLAAPFTKQRQRRPVPDHRLRLPDWATRRSLRWPSSTVVGLLDSFGGAAVHEHANGVPALEYEHGRLAGVALRLAGTPTGAVPSPCLRSPSLARQMRACRSGVRPLCQGRALPTGAAVESRRHRFREARAVALDRVAARQSAGQLGGEDSGQERQRPV